MTPTLRTVRNSRGDEMNRYLSHKTLQLLKEFHSLARDEVRTLKGKTLVWKKNPTNFALKELNLKGRRCTVVNAEFDALDGKILLRVKTENSNGTGFIESNDIYHRILRTIDYFETPEGGNEDGK